MNHTAQALMAIRLLQSLPNWERIAQIYEDLDDLASDLERNDWEDLIPSDEHLAAVREDQAWIDAVILEAQQAAA